MLLHAVNLVIFNWKHNSMSLQEKTLLISNISHIIMCDADISDNDEYSTWDALCVLGGLIV